MKIISTTILAILLTTAVLGQNSVTDNSTTVILTTVSTDNPITSEPTTTTVAPTTTAATVTPTTTTEAPTTTVAPTTTAAPTTTTVVPPTTTVPPATTEAPEPTPTEGSWNVSQNNVTCIRADIKAVFKISISNKTRYIALSPNATSDNSTCTLSNDTQKLVLSEPDYYRLSMIFAKDGDKFFVNETIFEYTLPEGTGIYAGAGSSDAKVFTVKVGNSYLCKSQTIQLGNVTMEVSKIHIEAFGGEGNTNFGAAEECESDDKVSDAVPIAVGCALAALIVIVLIAYLVGRRQSRQKGYQSV